MIENTVWGADDIGKGGGDREGQRERVCVSNIQVVGVP